MNEQIRATAITAPAAAPSPQPPGPEDAWDRLAALAFGDTTSAGGCSEHAHECTCMAEQLSEDEDDDAARAQDDTAADGADKANQADNGT